VSTGTRGLVVVDAANVVGSRPDGWWRDRAGAAGRLLAALLDNPAPDGDAVLVLEGAARAAAGAGPAEPGGGVRVFHAADSGDDAIVELVAAAVREDPGREVTVVTADRGLRRRVEDLGASTQGPHWLWSRLGEGE
jgi:predicted RNA-binding protein with PIN domain